MSRKQGQFVPNSIITVSSTKDGRVTIPKAIRDYAGIESGDLVKMEVKDGRLFIVGLTKPDGKYAPLKKWIKKQERLGRRSK